jgi:hypothetical protein
MSPAVELVEQAAKLRAVALEARVARDIAERR